MSSLDTLSQEVADTKTVMASAATLLAGLHAQLEAALASLAAGDNGAALAALSADLKTSTDALASAVQANTDPTP